MRWLMTLMFFTLPPLTILWGSLWLEEEAADTWATQPVCLYPRPGSRQNTALHKSTFEHSWHRRKAVQETFYSLCHRRPSEASIPSVSRISIWQEILWWAKNIYHLRRETQKCIISVASILPDHFTQTPGREKHYFTVRTLNVVHTLGSFFFSYVITAYLGVSHLEQPPEREGFSQEASDQSQSISIAAKHWRGALSVLRISKKDPPAEDGCRRTISQELEHLNMVSWPNFLITKWNYISRVSIMKSLDEGWQTVQRRRR